MGTIKKIIILKELKLKIHKLLQGLKMKKKKLNKNKIWKSVNLQEGLKLEK